MELALPKVSLFSFEHAACKSKKDEALIRQCFSHSPGGKHVYLKWMNHAITECVGLANSIFDVGED